MNILIITQESYAADEINSCKALLDSGIQRLHIRKPIWSEAHVRQFLVELGERYWDKISLHEHHALVDELNLGGKHFKSRFHVDDSSCIRSKSFHAVDEIKNENRAMDYGFLSPIYDSISKDGYQSNFDFDQLKLELVPITFPIYALGGVTVSKISQLKDLGFSGAVLMGIIWQEPILKKRMTLVEEILNA